MDEKALVQAAAGARRNAYVPYSGFAVGAALLCKGGSVYTGCNIENAGYGPTVCGERTAIFKAVSEGERDFAAIAVVGAPKDATPDSEVGAGFSHPCGVCRQVLREFCDDDFPIYVGNLQGEVHRYTLGELLPCSFGPENIR